MSTYPVADIAYAHTLGLRIEPDAAGGAPTLVMPYADALIGSPARLHGGAVAGLLEIAATAAVTAALAGRGEQAVLKPVNVTVEYLREGAMVDTQARAEIVKLGRRIAVVRALAWQDDAAKPIAAAHMILLVDRS